MTSSSSAFMKRYSRIFGLPILLRKLTHQMMSSLFGMWIDLGMFYSESQNRYKYYLGREYRLKERYTQPRFLYIPFEV